MTDKTDPAQIYEQAVKAEAERLTPIFANATPGDFEAARRALDLAERQRNEQQLKNSEAGEHKRLGKLNHAEFSKDTFDRYGFR